MELFLGIGFICFLIASVMTLTRVIEPRWTVEAMVVGAMLHSVVAVCAIIVFAIGVRSDAAGYVVATAVGSVLFAGAFFGGALMAQFVKVQNPGKEINATGGEEKLPLVQ